MTRRSETGITAEEEAAAGATGVDRLRPEDPLEMIFATTVAGAGIGECQLTVGRMNVVKAIGRTSATAVAAVGTCGVIVKRGRG